MGAARLKIIFKHGSLGVEVALQRIQAVLTSHDVPLTDYTLHDQSVTLPSVSSRLKRSKRKTFKLFGQGFEFLLGSVGNYHLDFLHIKSESEPSIPWDDWITQFLNDPNFVMAWVVDFEYDYWQNAEDPLQYTAVGKSYAHLRMKSNGLPYPVEQQIIDTSANPGRWCFRDGYIEAIGALMWLGAPFWSFTGADRRLVTDAPWLLVSYPAPSVMKIQSSEHLFMTSEGGSGELQANLRCLLFPVAR